MILSHSVKSFWTNLEIRVANTLGDCSLPSVASAQCYSPVFCCFGWARCCFGGPCVCSGSLAGRREHPSPNPSLSKAWKRTNGGPKGNVNMWKPLRRTSLFLHNSETSVKHRGYGAQFLLIILQWKHNNIPFLQIYTHKFYTLVLHWASIKEKQIFLLNAQIEKLG